MQYRAIADWPALRERYLAFWRGEVLDDLPLVHVQNPNPAPPEPEPWMGDAGPTKYLDPARAYDYQLWRRDAWNWHGDLFKYVVCGWGPNAFAGLVGAAPVFGRDTVWHEPLIAGLDEAERVRFDPQGQLWRRLLAGAEYFSARAAGDRQLGMLDFGGPADWLSVLMPIDRFLFATVEDPERLGALALRLAEAANRAAAALEPILESRNDGLCNWLPLWAPRSVGVVQDDIAVNLSPECYAAVLLPALRAMAARTEFTILHWHDACAHHLDQLLAAPEIDCIQYGHDPNTGPFRAQLPAMRRIQAAGKKLFISCVEAADAAFFVANLDPRGLAMIVNTADDDASARMLDDLRGWTAARLAELPKTFLSSSVNKENSR